MNTATTAKVSNYTPEQVQDMTDAYTANPTKETVSLLAEQFGKTTRSIVAKLSRLELYVKPERVTKTGEKVQKKDETADAIGAVLMLTEAETESLTKANKSALKKIFTALAGSRPIDGNE